MPASSPRPSTADGVADAAPVGGTGAPAARPSVGVSVSLLPGGGPGAGFERPFEMLGACHERVERMLRLLERLAAHLVRHGVDGQAAEAARDVMRYFDRAGPAHHEDEERHVLPRLRAADDPALHALADRLHADHARMSAAWVALRIDLSAIAEGHLPAARPDADADGDSGAAPSGPPIPAAWAAFAADYRAHIAVEDTQAFPAAQAGLVPESERAMGDEMAARRGVPPPSPR